MPGTMTYDEDQEGLAAEYVLGTLPIEERGHVEALMLLDGDLATRVRAWQRRLGELQAMIEPVEPPAELWDKIKAEIGTVAQDERTVPEAILLKYASVPSPDAQEPAETLFADTPAADAPSVDSPAITGPVGDEPSVEQVPAQQPPSDQTDSDDHPQSEPPLGGDAPAALSAEVIDLTSRLQRWRDLAIGASAVAAVLVLFVALREVVPVIWSKPKPVQVVQAKPRGGRYVAVLQKEPGTPAFMLTIDLDTGTLIVRRVKAEPQSQKSYELWLLSKSFSGPRSLGLVGAGTFTRRTTLIGYDAKEINEATFAISLEPQGGSPTGVPTGPMLFTGKLIEATPPDIPPPGG